MLLTPTQQREKAVQHAIASTFTGDSGAQIDILIAALSRVVRCNNKGRPLSPNGATLYTQLLCDSLTEQ